MRQWRSYIRKQYAWGHHLQNSGKSKEFPWLWVLAAGEPRTAIRGFGLSQESSDVPGVYISKAAPDLCLGLVVLPQLPKTTETLLLRLLSKGKALKAAMEEVSDLSEDHRHLQYSRSLGRPGAKYQGKAMVVRIILPDEKDKGLYLAPFWHEDARRPESEMKSLAGKPVQVIGVFHTEPPPDPNAPPGASTAAEAAACACRSG